MHMVEKIYLADYLLTQTGRTRYSKNMQFFFFFFFLNFEGTSIKQTTLNKLGSDEKYDISDFCSQINLFLCSLVSFFHVSINLL